MAFFCYVLFFVAPALARCDIGVRFSVCPSFRPSVRPSFRPQFTSTLAFKSILMTYSPNHCIHESQILCSMIRLQGFRKVKFSPIENSRWPPLLKIAKLIKSALSREFKMVAVTKNSKTDKIGTFSRTARYSWLKFCMEY